MGSDEEQRFNDLQASQSKSEQFQKHLAAQIAVLENICLVLSGQPNVKEQVLARLREVSSTCSKANQASPTPDPRWPMDELYLRRFMKLVEEL